MNVDRNDKVVSFSSRTNKGKNRLINFKMSLKELSYSRAAVSYTLGSIPDDEAVYAKYRQLHYHLSQQFVKESIGTEEDIAMVFYHVELWQLHSSLIFYSGLLQQQAYVSDSREIRKFYNEEKDAVLNLCFRMEDALN